MPKCQNCGASVTKRYVRVFTPEGVAAPRACPDCDDMVRRNGRPEPARSARHNGNAGKDGSDGSNVRDFGEAGWSR